MLMLALASSTNYQTTSDSRKYMTQSWMRSCVSILQSFNAWNVERVSRVKNDYQPAAQLG